MTDEDDTSAVLDELHNRLAIESQALGDVEYTPDKDHTLARNVADASLQYAAAMAQQSVYECSCEGVCPEVQRLHLLLTGILIPTVVTAAEAMHIDVTLGDLARMAESLANKMYKHARAAIGRPL